MSTENKAEEVGFKPIRERLREYIIGKEGNTLGIQQTANDFGCPASSVYIPIKELQSEGLITFNRGMKSFTILPATPSPNKEVKSKEEILDKWYETGMHWKSSNRYNILKAMEEYANQFKEVK